MLQMTAQGNSPASLRLERLEFSRLGWAFAISLAVHLVCWGAYTGGKKLGVWEKLHLPAWVQRLTQPLAKMLKSEPKPLFRETEPPLMFVNVSPDQASPEAPKNAKYYSSQNSQAANPQADADTADPKITGSQTEVPKTEDAERNKFPLQPALPAEKPQTEELAKPKPKLAPGDLALAKPSEPNKDAGTAEKARPRRLSELPPNVSRPPGVKMKQEGGVKRQLSMTSLDAKATPFGTYDALLVQAISQRWYDLLDSREYASDGRGKVALQFKLHYDGRVTELKVSENTVTETLSLICQKAVLDPAPFDKWPTEMRLMVGEDFRKIQFTFYYY